MTSFLWRRQITSLNLRHQNDVTKISIFKPPLPPLAKSWLRSWVVVKILDELILAFYAVYKYCFNFILYEFFVWKIFQFFAKTNQNK